MSPPAAVILAGGESRRMGRPKALLEIGGETFAQRLIRTFAAVCDPVILVTGATESLAVPPAVEVHNPNWTLGQLSSLQAGLAALPESAELSFFAPVDCPLFSVATVESLCATYRRTLAPLVIPRFGDKRGHPVLVDRAIIRELIDLPPAAQAREVVHRHRHRTVYVDVEDAGILADIDTPADFAKLSVNS